jgi:hypothetical protein
MNPVAESLTLTSETVFDPNRGGSFHGESPAGRAVANWHDENHAGAFAYCSEQPCDAVRRVDRRA